MEPLRVFVAQSLPRRARLRAPALAGAREACERVAHALAEGGLYQRVTVRPVTGSVIVEDEDRTPDARALARRLAELLAAERDDAGRPLHEPRPEEHPGPTRIAKAVAHAAAAINGDVREALDDRADLGTILPVFFAMAGLSEIGKAGKLPTPSWFNLLWWSLRSFMTFNFRAVEEESDDDDGEKRGHRPPL
jgi:hypothetical protein